MPGIFLSHKHEDKSTVLEIQKHLSRRLLRTWIDKTDMPGVAPIWGAILSGIEKCKYFLPFLSVRFCSSEPCLYEFQQAHAAGVEKGLFIIPVVQGDVGTLLAAIADPSSRACVKSVLKSNYWVKYDGFDIKKTTDEIADVIAREEGIYFNQLAEINLEGHRVQLIEFGIDERKYSNNELPPDFLKKWDFNIIPFLSENDSDNKVIKMGMPVLFSGRAPNWIYTFLTIPLNNIRTVYVYNIRTGGFVCVSSLNNDKDHFLGKTLEYKTSGTTSAHK